jgi:probable F420-dependent oxidoreductase
MTGELSAVEEGEYSLSSPRPFRFGACALSATSSAEWAERARRTEALGYATFVIPDHFGPSFAPIPALTAAALATTSLRVCCGVFDNDFRHPAVLAREAATLDLLSDGRFEFGIGAGYNKEEDYDRTGIPFDSPSVRVERLEEAVQLIKRLWEGPPVTFSGHHYQVQNLKGFPRPVQRPHPPIYIGAGGKRLLSFAAREADIVGLIAQALPAGGLAIAADTEAVLAQKVGWVREAARERIGQIELALLLFNVEVTAMRGAGADEAARPRGLTPDQVLASPYFQVGSVDTIADNLVSLRERFSISYFCVFPHDVDEFAPVVAKLAGQ